MTSVHHAEVIAHRIGEGLGTLVLALSVTIIEVGLIVSLMSDVGEGASVLARDTVFAAVMIITNGMVALCLILGGMKYKEQQFQVQGSNSLLVVLVTLCFLVFMLPNFTTTTAGPTYNTPQLVFTASACLLLYLVILFFQTTSHKAYFEPIHDAAAHVSAELPSHDVSGKEAFLSFISLCVSLVAVIGLAKYMSPVIEKGIAYFDAPRATVGLIIAGIVLLPEALAAANASRANRLQTSLNLALGSAIASIALTIPAVIVYSIVQGRELKLGLEPKQLTFLLMTLIVGSLSLGTGKTNLLQGVVHGVILLAFIVFSFIP
jgi:Ca2+:H+ antiporter